MIVACGVDLLSWLQKIFASYLLVTSLCSASLFVVRFLHEFDIIRDKVIAAAMPVQYRIFVLSVVFAILSCLIRAVCDLFQLTRCRPLTF